MARLTGNTWDHTRGYDPVAASAAAFAVETGSDVDIRWDRRSLQAFADQPLDELAARYDLIVVDHPHVGQVAADGCLLPIDEFTPAETLDALARDSVGRSHESYQLAGHQWALAIDAACHVAAVRPDVAGEAPVRWDQVFELADAGLVLWPLKPVDSICTFETLAANMGSPCGEDGRFIAPSAGLSVLDLMRSVADKLPEACLRMNPFEVLDLLAAGDAGYGYCPLLFGYTNYSRTGYRDRVVSFADIPTVGDGPYGAILGGAGLAISRRTAHPELAVRYALWLASGAVQRGLYVEHGGQPAHRAAWDDDEANALCGDFFRRTRRTMDASWLRPRHAGFIHFQARAGDLVNAYLRQGGEPRRVVDELNRTYQDTLP